MNYRITQGAFRECLQHLYKNINNKDLQVNICGKPTVNTFTYTKWAINNLKKDFSGEIYMIGDNPKSDIKGANENGFIRF
ncbi:unnamed protein product [Didymodactylos carnosus]|uniref:Uncharacterized protein n=1 Tax=Didymodactylos carnosus TaxID=1234261 RepID=A0A816EGJ4_9BILA|nr:unnamed protein product [Didymodactylos carnosus]CAF1648864.1 unnamed protein product [Didymodactylos carnosus]CAF4455850.1 unnamed protein product [Didymodactylos carnosus]CAF4573091.1 unnamed protein product [Didymodactylos carnosus]